jgi:hypothetical protein
MSTEIESNVDIRARIAKQLEQQQAAAAAMRTTGSYISFKNAQLKVDGQPVPNNQAEVRVLAVIGERSWYSSSFDADVAQVPTCYALDSASPHPEAQEQQSANCIDCKWNRWGTATDAKGKPARGKACREGARIIVVPANVPLKSAPMYTAKIPVTSLGAVTAFSSRCSQAQRLSGEFITQLSVTEDKKSFFKVHLTIKEHTPDIDPELLLTKQDQAYQLAMTPYPNLAD